MVIIRAATAAFAATMCVVTIHEIGPDAAAAPQKAPGQNVMPSYVIDIARRTCEERGRLLTIELHIPEVENVEQFDIGIFRNERMITA